jgi:(p)ppGpp synthase/HD superfamily hydrolase
MHAGQKRAHGAPYFEHPKAVARILWDRGYRGDVILAAYLHDTIEDCGVTAAMLLANFGPGVAGLVCAVTHPKGEPLGDYYRRVKRHGPDAMALKLADRDHNNSELHLLPLSRHRIVGKARVKTALMLKIFNEPA